MQPQQAFGGLSPTAAQPVQRQAGWSKNQCKDGIKHAKFGTKCLNFSLHCEKLPHCLGQTVDPVIDFVLTPDASPAGGYQAAGIGRV